jgi:multiple sugar transport system permease protein
VPTDHALASGSAASAPRRAETSLSLRRFGAVLGKGIAVVMVLLWSIGPIAMIVSAAFTPEREIFAVGSSAGWRPTLDNFVALWNRWGDFFTGLANSLIVTIGATLLAVLVSMLAGFGYSRWRSRFLSGSVFAMIALRLLPPIVTTLPLFPIVNALGLNDTYTVLILLYAAFFVSLGTMVMRTFIDQIPRELDEAAMMDGATQRQIVTRVILPLSAQGMVAVAIFVIVYAWNEFLFAFIFTTKHAKTAPLVMSEMIGSLEGVEWGVLFAATSVQLLPILIFVVLCQRHLIEGLTAGATKG